MKKIISVLVAALMLFSLAACSGGGKKTSSFDVTEDEGLFTLNIPAEYNSPEMTQKDYDEAAEQDGYESVTLNDDGSVTYVMTVEKHDEMMKELGDGLRSALDQMCLSEDYPNIVSIKPNDDFTEYEVVTKSEELDAGESGSILGFYIYTAFYGTFNGNGTGDCTVKFINEATGEVIDTLNSADLG